MSWRSKYKQTFRGWWDDEEEYYNGRYSGGGYPDTDGYGGYNSSPYYSGSTTYYNKWYKPKFDLSTSLETRVVQLIKTITGKTLRLSQAKGWGADDKYFYYNPEDLKDATDDEVLGRILHQLARELYLDLRGIEDWKKSEKPSRHLIEALENNRADCQLQQKYLGCHYYAEELWHSRKFTDNPLLNASGEGETIQEFGDRIWGEGTYKHWKQNVEEHEMYSWEGIEEHCKSNGWVGKSRQIDAAEFNFNIDALQNGETEWDFSKPAVEENFKKAVPFIKQYMETLDDDERLKAYEEVKKYYPKPSKEEQEEMDRQQSQIGGQLSQAEMDALQKEAEKAMKAARGKGRDGKEFNNRPEYVDNERGELSNSRDMQTYRQYQNEKKPTINTLYALINSILTDNRTKRYARPFKRGKLDAKRMYKYLATDNLRIFKKPTQVSRKEYPMAIVVDLSGSMHGSKAHEALKGAIVLAETMEKLELPYEVIGYNGAVYNFKKFHEPLQRDIVARIARANGDNNEPEALRVLTQHFKEYDPSNSHHKSVFFVTDGQAYNPSETKAMVTELENHMNTKVYAIGIGNGVYEDDLQRAYNTYLKVDEVNELPMTLVNLMRAQFRRR